MKNRAKGSHTKEAEFINGGTAMRTVPESSTQLNPDEEKIQKRAKNNVKAKSVSISLTQENLTEIDAYIRNEILEHNSRVNRSDIVRAAIAGLKTLSSTQISELIGRSKLQ